MEKPRTIWDIRVVRVIVYDDEAWVESLSVRNLLDESAPEFVRAILMAVRQGKVYDDSDPSAGNLLVWYLPANKVHVDLGS